jgi:myosin protein heavy chain
LKLWLKFALPQTALATVGFSVDEQFDMFRILAAILHIGNIEFKEDGSNQAMISSMDVVEKVCHLLGLSLKDFTKAVLRPTVKAGREIVTQARTKRQAEDELAAMCKTMYEKAFGRIVERINQALDRPEDKSCVTEGRRNATTVALTRWWLRGRLFIGVLDIAGFEIFGEALVRGSCPRGVS